MRITSLVAVYFQELQVLGALQKMKAGFFGDESLAKLTNNVIGNRIPQLKAK